jgi:creatinine amidohydrolase
MLIPEGVGDFGRRIQDLEPSGACGDAASADADRGGFIVQRGAKALARLCREVHAYPMDRIARKALFNAPRQGDLGNRS